MIIAIDAGNSRIKWATHEDGRWLDSGVLATSDVCWLAEAADEWPAGGQAVVCNVAGAAVAAGISSSLAARHARVSFLRPTVAACGVSNSYDLPGQLGADRWAALIGARSQSASACLVVCAGTATTVDLLDAGGVFRGGLILPGFDLMRAALASNTAQLPLADEGSFRTTPRNTSDAIVSGCLQAQLGAVERMFAGIASEAGAQCLLTGGAAERLAAHLRIPFLLVDNLILRGLVRYAESL
ncbi:MAG: Type III pantothenate kinase [Candidatus Accumulibacter sp. BA-94]|jgi:type III pantothenate kinase|uniref:type III pantothenate kinase n=1 Tax=Accumulibacter sp. TaxID=2053492 RepID=UPI00045312CD|nr:type III pantothenate kinase [Accumulibacter sp.]EXI87218.1 MAG: Type III pantothenate kinase [Candidatus Accumulibacter sp. BA-94]MBL8390810.1 type III pantothenate kinase [Accumulibacter sp.]HRD87547.1 type III pantothenate kinase [Accumulibacter sp.]